MINSILKFWMFLNLYFEQNNRKVGGWIFFGFSFIFPYKFGQNHQNFEQLQKAKLKGYILRRYDFQSLLASLLTDFESPFWKFKAEMMLISNNSFFKSANFGLF